MHILFLSHYFPPEVNAPATRTHEHCREWVEAGHQVTVITCAPNCPSGIVYEGYRNVWKSEELVDGIRVVRVWTYLAANKGFLRRVINYLSYLVTATWRAVRIRDVDVVVATSPQFFCGWAGVLCHWFKRRPFVLEIRDIWPESIVTVGAMRHSPVIKLLEWLERRMYAAADHIVTVGQGYRDKLLERGVPPERVSVIPNGVNLARFQPRSPCDAFRGRWNGNGKFVCAYLGTIGLAHGLDVILDAAEQLAERGRDDVVFWIVGDGADRQRLEESAGRRQLANVHFTGIVPKSAIPDVIASCDACLVHLRGTELFGTVIPSKIFEIMAMNVPIIIAVRGEATQHVLAARAGLAMPPDDHHELIACIDKLLRDREPVDGRRVVHPAANPADTGISETRDRISGDPSAPSSRDPVTAGRDYLSRHFDRRVLAGRLLDILMRLSNRPDRPIVNRPSTGSEPPIPADSTQKAA